MPEIIITAVYENGVLRPVHPLALTEGQTVKIQIVPEVLPEKPQTELDKVFQSMVDQGAIRLLPKKGQVDPDIERKWREVFENLKGRPGKPLSEIIIEERGEW